MESAIPKHLRCPRLRDRRISDEFTPSYPATVARYDSGVKQVAMAYFGVQHPADANSPAPEPLLRAIADSFDTEGGAKHWDRAHYIDEAGFSNTISIGYWDDAAIFSRWFQHHGSEWVSSAARPGVGTFIEILQPTVERFETLYSADIAEGVGGIAAALSPPIQEHAYWGAMRDRFPAAQTSGLEPSGEPLLVTRGLHQRVVPHDNICLIRSGQDWSCTDSEDRRMYLEEVEPIFRAGMDFLRDEGLQIECFANRYMTVVDSAGRPTEKTFGMSWWRSLAALERWAESHPTHVAIFGAAMKYLGTLGSAARLKLYHEVTVAAAAEQHFEYFNCHPLTGMLRSTRP